MPVYSAAFKARVVKRLVGPQAVSATQLAEAVGVPQPTLSRWVRELRSVEVMPRRPQAGRTGAEKLRVVQDAANLDEAALGALLRREGLQMADLAAWRQAADKAAHARIAPLEAMLVDEVLPDGHRVAAAAHSLHDQFAVRLAGALRRGPARSHWTRHDDLGGHRVGGHRARGGRIWRWPLRRATGALAHDHAGGLEVPTDRFAAHARRRLDAPQRPPQSPQRDHLLLFGLVQDVAHGGKRPSRNAPPGYASARLWWPVFRCPLVAGLGCPPRDVRLVSGQTVVTGVPGSVGTSMRGRHSRKASP